MSDCFSYQNPTITKTPEIVKIPKIKNSIKITVDECGTSVFLEKLLPKNSVITRIYGFLFNQNLHLRVGNLFTMKLESSDKGDNMCLPCFDLQLYTTNKNDNNTEKELITIDYVVTDSEIIDVYDKKQLYEDAWIVEKDKKIILLSYDGIEWFLRKAYKKYMTVRKIIRNFEFEMDIYNEKGIYIGNFNFVHTKSSIEHEIGYKKLYINVDDKHILEYMNETIPRVWFTIEEVPKKITGSFEVRCKSNETCKCLTIGFNSGKMYIEYDVYTDFTENFIDNTKISL